MKRIAPILLCATLLVACGKNSPQNTPKQKTPEPPPVAKQEVKEVKPEPMPEKATKPIVKMSAPDVINLFNNGIAGVNLLKEKRLVVEGRLGYIHVLPDGEAHVNMMDANGYENPLRFVFSPGKTKGLENVAKGMKLKFICNATEDSRTIIDCEVIK